VIKVRVSQKDEICGQVFWFNKHWQETVKAQAVGGIQRDAMIRKIRVYDDESPFRTLGEEPILPECPDGDRIPRDLIAPNLSHELSGI
jgi:hypothetical protein